MLKFSEFLFLLGQHCFLDFVSIANDSVESYANIANTNTNEVLRLNPSTCTSFRNWSRETANEDIIHFTRFASISCSASVIFFNSSSTVHHINVLKHLESQKVLRQHPNYIFLVSKPSLLYNLQVVFKYIHISSQYLFVHLARKIKIYSVCLWCSLPSSRNVGLLEINLDTSYTSHSDAFQKMENAWWKLHKNMSQSKVFTHRKSLESFLDTFPPYCDHLDQHFEGDPRLCILKLLSQRLNYDFKYKKSISVDFNVEEQYNDVVSNCTHHDGATANTIDNWQASTLYRDYSGKKNTKMMWIPWGWMKDPLSFVIVFHKSYLKETALLRPFDTITWVLLLVSIILMSSVLTLSLWTFRAYYLNMNPAMDSLLWRNSLLMTLGSIMEQNPSELTAKKNVLSFRISFQTWLLVSIIITNAYTGIVISFLCSEILPPNLPNNLEELAENFQTFPMISVDYIYIPELDYILHYSSALIQEYIGILVAYQGNDSFKSYYNYIDVKTIYIDIENKKVPAVYDRGLKIPANINSLKKDLILPEQFTFISTKAGTKFFSSLMQDIPGIITWSPPPEAEQEERVYALTAFTVPRNFFYPLINRYLGWIVESGLPNIWTLKGEELIRKWNQQDLECWRELKNITMFWNSWLCIETTTTTTHAIQQQQAEDYDSKPLQIESLYMPIVLCFFGLGVCFVGFIFEVCSGGMWRRVKFWYWIHKESSIRTQNLRPLHVNRHK